VALINGVTGLVWAVGGRPRVVFSFTLTGGKITAIDLIGDPGTLGQLDVVTLAG
jgi:RNA polymerase sigma-70 factor (ECF subfamily)